MALAANVYSVDGSTKPGGKGSKSKPTPIQLKFDFTVESDDPTVRGTPIEQYAIGSEGLVTFPEAVQDLHVLAGQPRRQHLAGV